MRRTPLIPLAIAATALLATALPAQAVEAPPEVLADELMSALSLAVAEDGTVFVAQNFTSTITKIAPGGEVSPFYADEGQREVGALSVDGDVLTFATTGEDGAKVYTLSPDPEGGYAQEQIADLGAYEAASNPDKSKTYGIVGLSKSCTKQVPKGYRPHKGIKESHPYASTTVEGLTYVADAGANAIWAIGNGVTSTVAVLPPTSIKITKQNRKVLEVPKCTIGKTFRAEGVPTDVEVGPDGHLYVTSLPGGPEDPRMGANGSVYRVELESGKTTKVESGLTSPTGLAVAPDGTRYVAMLFGGAVAVTPPGGPRSVFDEVAAPGDVEYADGDVYVTESGFGPTGPAPVGTVLKYVLGVG